MIEASSDGDIAILRLFFLAVRGPIAPRSAGSFRWRNQTAPADNARRLNRGRFINLHVVPHCVQGPPRSGSSIHDLRAWDDSVG